ncbi:hypothetical protein GI584_17435 [Gracilibacillus salitolerans]|uniref:Uncharacterized protein n=1 Tax=Gracilibacillus salitolerans TaxID=2663022 RepID=A0A5Q2TPQ0_9BACI|nr:hypothetical protein GI584_17435 [Gracilibacillus salitolerans]
MKPSPFDGGWLDRYYNSFFAENRNVNHYITDITNGTIAHAGMINVQYNKYRLTAKRNHLNI